MVGYYAIRMPKNVATFSVLAKRIEVARAV